ncbi:MAG: redox-sensing transcriptional repressor Rex [Gemmatimonadales bacterium]|nr:redox-sensing transcriptional repressor Rex [Gemmatimonadales bacterium]
MRHVAPSTIRRLSLYLQFLDQCEGEGKTTVSSRALAERGGATAAQVRKDLSIFGSFGKRGIGYPTSLLAARLRDILGLGRRHRVILVGAGRIGAALANYPGFEARGFEIAAIYDADPDKVGVLLDGNVVRAIQELEPDLSASPVDIAVIGTPAAAAQGVADRLVRAGVRALLNFAPVTLAVPHEVTVTNVNMALELEALSFALTRRRA